MCLLLFACQTTQPTQTSQSPAANAEQVKLSLFSWPGYGFWYIAKEKNLVPEVNLDIKLIEDPFEIYNLVKTGQLDVASSTAEYGPIAAEQKSAIKLVNLTNVSYGTDKIIVGPKIKTPADLKGKKVAVLEGFLTQIYMGIWLEKNGLNFRDVKYANLGLDDAVAGLVSGEVEAAELWEPFAQKVLDTLPGSRVVSTSLDEYLLKTGLLADGIYMNAGFIQNRPNAAKLTLKAYYAALDFWRKNPKEGNEIIARNLKYTVPDVEKVLGADGNPLKGGLYAFTYADAARFMGVFPGDPPFGMKNNQISAHWKLTSEWWQKFGLIKKVLPPESGIALEPMKALVAEQPPA
jgi:NitT/TauT family transport system substrate-binding protein